MAMLRFQPNSNPNLSSNPDSNQRSNSGYTVSSSSSFSQSPLLSANRRFSHINRARGLRYRPTSVNSVASNFSSLSASSTYVNPSSIYEGHEGHDDIASQYPYGRSGDEFDGFDDADNSIPDAYDEDRFNDYEYGYPAEDGYDDPSGILYHDTSTIENALPFYVLAVYDFTEGDPENMLLFERGDLLEIISIQSSGWWAAQALDHQKGTGSTKEHQTQPDEQEGVGWIPSAFVNVIPTHLVQRLKDTPREYRIAEYERAELFVESPEDIDSIIQNWGLDLDTSDRAEERGDEQEGDQKEVVEEVIEETPQVNKVQHTSFSLQTHSHPAGPRVRPLPSINSGINGGSGTPPQVNTSLPVPSSNPSKSQTTTTATAPTTTGGPDPIGFTSPIQPSPVTPVPPNVPAPAPFNLGRRNSLGVAVSASKQRDLPPSLPPPAAPLPPLPEVVEPEIENTVAHSQPHASRQLPNPLQHQRSTSASTIGSVTTTATVGTPTPSHKRRTPSPLPTPPISARSHGVGAVAGGSHSTSTLTSTTTSGGVSTTSSHSGVSGTTTNTSPLSAPSTCLWSPCKDKSGPSAPRPAATDFTSYGKGLERERSNSASDSARSASPPYSPRSAPGDDGHPSVLIPGGLDAASGPHPTGHNHSASFSAATHSRSASSLSSLGFLPRSRSVSHGQGSGGSHKVISNTISNSLSSLRRRAARYGGSGGSGSVSGGTAAPNGVTATETINITSSPRSVHQRLLSDETASGATAAENDVIGSTTSNLGSGRNDDFDTADEFDDDDSVLAAKRQQDRASPSSAVAPVQAGDKEKLRKLLGDDALYFLNASTGANVGGNGVNVPKGANGSSSSLPSTSTGKASAGAFARRRRENKRQSEESDSFVNANERPGSSSSLPGTSIGSPSTNLNSVSNPVSNSEGPVSHLDLTSSLEDIGIDIELEQDTDAELDDGQAPGGGSFSPLLDGQRSGSVTPLTARIPRTPRTPRTPHTPQASLGTPRTAGFPAVTGAPLSGKGDKVRRLLGDDDAQAFHNAKQALASQPWYLKPERDGDSGEIRIEHDGSVKSGSVEALVERLTVPFLRSDLEKRFRHVFLLTFHSFTTAERVLELLIDKYEMDSPPGLNVEEFNEWKDKKLRPTQARVLHVLTLWVDNYGLIQDDPRVIPRLQDFLELIHSPPQNAQNARLILENIATKRWTDINLPALESVAATRRIPKFSRTKTDILQIEHGELARHLTLYEARLYLKVRPHECFKFAANQKAEGISNLRAFISTSDRIASWVKMSVLKNDPLGKRADVIQFWIRVAERCRALNNFSSTAAIVAALTSQVIARLQLTWAHVSRTNRIDPLLKIFETTNNFASYRNTLMMVDAPCVPYIGIFLSDMVKISEGFPDPPKLVVPVSNASAPSTSNHTGSPPIHSSSSQQTREVKLINFAKYSKMEDVAQMILKFQPKVRDTYKLVEVVSTMQFVESQLNLAASKDENEYWTRSQALQRSELAHVDIRIGLEEAGF